MPVDNIRQMPKKKKEEVIKALPASVLVSGYHTTKREIRKQIYIASSIVFVAVISALLLTFELVTDVSLNYYVSSLPQEREDVYYAVDLPEGVQTTANLENKYKFLPHATPAEITERAAVTRENQIAAVIAAQVTDKVRRGSLTDIYQEAGDFFMIPWQILAAVHYVETGQAQDTTRTSYAGATGPMQFMPRTFAYYAVDGDGDGIASIYDVHDAIFTAAKYLAANGAAQGNISAALYRYNHSYSYVNYVLAVARSMGYRR